MKRLWQAIPLGMSRRVRRELRPSSSLPCSQPLRAGDVVTVKGSNGSRTGQHRRSAEGALRAAPHAVDEPGRKLAPMLAWLSEYSSTFSRPERLPIHHLPHRRRDGDGAALRVLVRPADHPCLRIKQGKGQPIRADGPQRTSSKKRHADHGRADDPVRLLFSTLLWANLTNLYVWVVLLVTLGFGAIGFYDDYLKVTKQTHKPAFAAARGSCSRP